MHVSDLLVKWYEIHNRDLPWRRTNSPYHIWLSEIILQQTRVIQGLAFYLKFVEQYPRIEDLAGASLDDVLKLWQGLGYYSRARNLHETAKFIVSEFNGVFPGSYEDLRHLKGIGNYTAAAIASFAYREPVAVVDGNVYRVISRVFGIELSIDTAKGKAMFKSKAQDILGKHPHIHNQAIMELGALVCLPKKPRCVDCPLASECFALKTGRIDALPVRSVRKPLRDRYFNYLFIVNKGFTWLSKRDGKDIWHSLYEFPLIETPGNISLENLSVLKEWKDILGSSETGTVGAVRHYRHQLTHQSIHCNFYQINAVEEPEFGYKPHIKISTGDLKRYAVPRLIEKYLTDLSAEKIV